MMRLYLGVLLAFVLSTGCDDGDLTFDTIDFEDVATARCGNKLYKLNDKEALIVNIGLTDAAFNAALVEEPTGALGPAQLVIDGTNNIVVYNLYDGAVGSANICAPIAPIEPSAIENWNATSGTIQITTAAELVANTTTGFEGGQKITGYRHNIIFRNIEFEKSSGTTQLYPEFNFGSFTKPITTALPITFDEELEKCSNNLIYNFSGTHGMTLAINPSLIDGSILDTPRTEPITTAANIFQYLIYEAGPLSGAEYFCNATPVANPLQTWVAVSGDVEVVSTSNGGTSKLHTIRLKNVVLQKGNSSFILATDYLLGSFISQ